MQGWLWEGQGRFGLAEIARYKTAALVGFCDICMHVQGEMVRVEACVLALS